MLVRALAAIIAGGGVEPDGLATPDEIERAPDICRRQPMLGQAPVGQADLLIRTEGFGLSNNSNTAEVT